MLDMMNMMGKVKEMQARLKQAQDNLELITVSGEAGAGMVRATVNGKKKLLSVEIDPSIVSPGEKFLLQDLVVAAVNKAMEEAEMKAKEELRKSTEGILPNIPGMDLSNLMG
ncbi:MAG: YbaB/EbfC family nucleoid-associated protein [Cyclobacteriaceae bacterium]|jgi:DNA-binding YbaB/EbfC family protein|nr:DNA-binding protein [Cytophagales bacterium]HNP77479.1 YbaB/EbfC family nucleoid-associated protein [Cyclobacteriaceae bacterium]HQQ83724.1 YbaB/EbfC family nucleoid-associated protein [Cyclobacteriaceae bacterium]